jgi:hypothetical protein
MIEREGQTDRQTCRDTDRGSGCSSTAECVRCVRARTNSEGRAVYLLVLMPYSTVLLLYSTVLLLYSTVLLLYSTRIFCAQLYLV